MKKTLIFALITAVLLLFISLLTTLSMAQQFSFTGVYAEAIQSANLRAAIGTEADVMGEIQTGTRYPVIGQSELYPWLLLGNVDTAQPIGWVFKDLVNIYNVSANLEAVPFTDVNVKNLVAPSASPTLTPTLSGTDTSANNTPDPGLTLTLLPSSTPQPEFSVFGTTLGEVNVRYKPDVSADRLGVEPAGTVFQITGYHTQFPWVQIAYPASPSGYAWIAKDLLDISGDLFSTRAITSTNFNTLPTLTATSAVLGSSSVLSASTPVPVSADFEALGNQLWNIMLDMDFDPATSRFGALYLLDLRTGQQIMFGNDVAFSGTSINKVGILVELFGLLGGDPDN
ncbi:MAG TPA: hypothetical protein VHL11_12300, partial [Phototrophicaceae bacterium]|nr:hypothetical protein [Phototrophicaceae bacterium]